MSRHYRWIGAIAIAIALGLVAAPAEAQFYGGGYWGGYGGGQTPQGSFAQGMGMYAMGMGRYNVETAQARSINAETAMQWNQYIYNSRVESARLWRAKQARELERNVGNTQAIENRLRDNPNQVDIARGDALNVALDEISNPKVFSKAVYYGAKVKVGGEMIRDIPFQYASAAISTSVHQLTQGPPPAFLRRDEFANDAASLRAIADELRKEGQELDAHKPETIKKAKDQIMATRAKVEATFPANSQERRDAIRYIKALYGLASMLETPAVNVLLAGVENRPEATLGDLLSFMAAYNLRFGASTTTRQRQVYMTLFPMLDKLRDELSPTAGAPATAGPDAPGAAFDGLDFNHAEAKTPPPAAQPPR